MFDSENNETILGKIGGGGVELLCIPMHIQRFYFV